MAPIQRLLDRVLPTWTPSHFATAMLARQAATTTVVAPNGNNDSSALDAGAIVSIIIGSIAGFLLLLWMIHSCSNLGTSRVWSDTFGSRERLPTSVEPVYVKTSSRGLHHHRHGHCHGHHHRSRSRHFDHSPRRSFEIRNLTSAAPVYVEHDGTPRVPKPVYYTRNTR
jgi:hypothetical protein